MERRNVYDIEMLKSLRGNTKPAEFARVLGVTRMHYYNFENGRQRELPFDIIQKLKDMFNLTPEQVCKLMGIK